MLWEKEEQEGVCDKISSRASTISLGPRTPSEPGPPWTPAKGTPLVLWEVVLQRCSVSSAVSSAVGPRRARQHPC